MKIKHNAIAALILTAMTVFVACKKNEITLLGVTPTGARVKLISACSNCPSLLMTANGQTINPTALAYGGAFPTGNYAVLPSGDVTLDFIRSDSSKSLFSTKVSLADGKYYSIYVGDTVPTPNISLIEDDIKVFQDTVVRLRSSIFCREKQKIRLIWCIKTPIPSSLRALLTAKQVPDRKSVV